MKLFTIDKNGKFVQFKEQEFREENKEVDLEVLLENNPEYFFDNSKILIIGRQVTTNLNTFIDLLGIDELGNTVVIELKRNKTPRETLAQLIEYASFIDNLDYEQLNEIFQNYSGEEVGLEEYHQQYYKNATSQNVSWNKNSKLVIVAQHITKEIKQTSLYLRKKGIDVYCLEFKYFANKENVNMISSDFVVGDEEFIRQKIKSETQLPKTTKEIFLKSLDNNGKKIFTKLFELIEEKKLFVRWGSKGFSANVKHKSDFIGVFFGWPINSPWGQSIATGFGQIENKLENGKTITDFYKKKIEELQLFKVPVKFFKWPELKWNIDNDIDENKLDNLITILKGIIELVEKELKESPAYSSS